MKKTTYTFTTLTEVTNLLGNIAKAYALVAELGFVEGDMNIYCNAITRLDAECAAYDDNCPWEYYLGIRHNGVEGAENREAVKKSIILHNDKVVAGIKVSKSAPNHYEVKFNRREIA